MMIMIQNLINTSITTLVCFYALSKLLKEKIDYKSYKWWFIFILNILWLTVSYLITDNLIRILIYYIFLTFSANFLFKKNNASLFFSTFIVLFLFFVSEIFFAILMVSILDTTINDIRTSYFNTLFTNLAVSLFVFLIVNIKRVIFFFQDPNFMIYLKNKRNTIAIFMASIFTISMLLNYILFEVSVLMGFIYILTLSIIYLLLILGFAKEKNQNIKLQIKYGVLINNLNEYEKMLDIQRINNHENKNHLVTIRGMLKKTDHEAIKYISNLLETKLSDDEELLHKTKKLPFGGLQGLIYQKLLVMKEKKIDISLQVSKSLNTIILEKISDLTNQHLCTIVGIGLDNAIEAVETLEIKKIGINVYSEEGYLIIAISNNFEGSINLDKIDERGYSTKGKGRGYGLSLAKQILEHNSSLKLEREIIGNIFKQKLKIKI